MPMNCMVKTEDLDPSTFATPIKFRFFIFYLRKLTTCISVLISYFWPEAVSGYRISVISWQIAEC